MARDWHFAFVVLMTSWVVSSAIWKSNLTDQAALLALKSHLDFHPFLARNWSTATSFCQWAGVSCSARHNRVAALNLSSMNLRGTLPPQIGNLSFLVSIDLSVNSIGGALPEELGHLRRLKFMDLGINSFSGGIPSRLFPSLSKLQHLLLRNSSLTGTIPTSLFNITTLKTIDFTGNFLQGSIPQEIGFLANLQILRIRGNQLSGAIPYALLNSSSIRVVNLAYNNLHGSLPEDLCSPGSKLEFLNLGHNMHYGRIPKSLYKCGELQRLGLYSNDFTGSIPRGIGNLTKLETMVLVDNKLTGSIPREIGNCTSLLTMFLVDNNFTGTIPNEIGNLQYLQNIDLSFNGITGSIPSTIFNISMASLIDLSKNYLSGQLPIDTGLWLPNIEALELSVNLLSGPIPESISNASKLGLLDLSYNSFSGFLPDLFGNIRGLFFLNLVDNLLTSRYSSPESNFISSLTNCKNLKTLWLDGNPWNCSLPISMGNLSDSLQEFTASNCSIKGNIPREIGDLSKLLSLELPNNELVGPIPNSIGKLNSLQGLFLENNKLNGSIPIELCSLESLSYLYLGSNKLSGHIPNCLGYITSLREVQVNDNWLSSEIPSTLWKLKYILQLNLSLNMLNGSLSSEIGNLKVVTMIDVSQNQLSKEIPSSIGGLKDLVYLSLSKNMLIGNIPESVSDLVSLEFFDLSGNGLSGVIPESLKKLVHLKYFNVSFNKLEGRVPDGGSFTNFSAESFMGNVALCGSTRMHLQPCRNSSPHPSKKHKMFIFVVLPIISCVILTISIIIIFMRHRKHDPKLAIKEDTPPLATWRRISSYEIERATGGFQESNLLGAGSFGSVYKGILSDDMIVAVKVFNLQQEGALTSFDTESEVLRNLRHRNLVKIISSCCNLDFKALVLQYLPNWSLDKWLYSHNYFLNVHQRLDIMIDVASALDYLHYGYSTSVVHCDLKPSNVLLDENMVAHVGDFGLAKLLSEGDSMKQTMTLATIGYMSPEFGSEGVVSIRGDVYSYGILLMETFTRKKPTDKFFEENMNLTFWVKQSLPDTVIQVADANLLSEEEEHFTAKMYCVTSVLELAVKCSADLPHERMNMKDVLTILKKIKTKFLQDTQR